MPRKSGASPFPPKLKERDYYEPIQSTLETLLREKTINVYLERTAEKNFSETLKSAIPQGQEIIFNFLRSSRPDITGYLTTKYGSKNFIVAEVKPFALGLEDIYQLRRYVDLFSAEFAFLVSPQPIPEELKRLATIIPQVRQSGNWRLVFVLARFDAEKKTFTEWFPENPFEKEFPWEHYQAG